LLATDQGIIQTSHGFLRTALIVREIRKATRDSGLSMRPYVLRAYFTTALDIAESKVHISHPRRQYLIVHKREIEATYSTNKRSLPETIEGMRSAYLKCTKFFGTEERGDREEDYEKMLRDSAIDTLTGAFSLKPTEEQKEELRNLDTREYQKRLGEIFKDRKADILPEQRQFSKSGTVQGSEKMRRTGMGIRERLPGKQGDRKAASMISQRCLITYRKNYYFPFIMSE